MVLLKAPHGVVLLPQLPPVIATPVVQVLGARQAGPHSFPCCLEEGNTVSVEEIGL